MAGDPRVIDLLEEMLDSGKTPDEVCRGCPELLTEVRERWIEFRRIDAAVVEFLPGLRTAPAADAVTPISSAAGLPEVPGFELLGEVGRGGMGVIHRARDLALDRHVAVKVLQDRYQADSPIGRRFTHEARITAQLQHPGVPAVYQVGALADGRPFLAMKLIKGHTLADLLVRRADPAADRGRFVAIFEQICQAVAYAHSLRVIHRDLKPSNIMVGKFGEVQVMDWGLGKVLPAGVQVGGGPARESPAVDGVTVIRTGPIGAGDTPGESEGLTPPTRDGSVLGTPAYMAPEQAGGEVDRLDERADVFGLGAVLCEVLTGRPPYTGRDECQIVRKALRADLADTLCRLDDSGAEPELVALCRRCLSAEPDDRPRDAGEVAGAVTALRAAAEDRARRAELDRVRAAELGKRRRVLLAGSGVVAVVLLVGLSVSLWQMVRAMDAEGRAKSNEAAASEERDLKAKALEAETKARQQAFAALRTMTADVVEQKFAQGTTLTEEDRAFLRGVIAQFDAFAAIKGGDADSQALRAEGRMRVGWMRYRLGEMKEAEKDYGEALSIRMKLAADFPARSEFRHELAGSYNNRGMVMRAMGRLKEAEEDWNEALSIREKLAAEFPGNLDFRQNLAGSYNNRGVLRREMGRPREAEEDHDRAAGIRKQLVAEFPSRPDFRRTLAGSQLNLGILQRDAGRIQEAEEQFNRALNIQKQLAADFPARLEYRQELANGLNIRGSLLSDMGRFKEAEEDFDQALSIRMKLAADFPARPDLGQALASSHINRGTVLRTSGRVQEAEKDFDRALVIFKQLAADFPNQPDLRGELAGTYVNLAILQQKQGNWAAAKRLLLEGRLHHLAALETNPKHPSYRQFYRSHLATLTVAHAGLLESEEAVRTAETCRDLGWDAPADAYDAACYLSLCVPIVAEHAGLDATQRKDAALFYGDAAMKLLRDAVSKGYKDVAHIKKDPDLDPLRQRDDFRKLVAELEGMAK
jgi:serine/threonine protein kinase/Tfp pilus assembly protein PilF